jgi:hypothetical protein
MAQSRQIKRRRIEVKAKAINLLAITALLGTFLAASQGTAVAATCSVPVPYPTIQSAVNDPNCTTINVAPGPRTEDVVIPRAVIINGAQAGNPVVGRIFGTPTESTVAGQFTLQAANITIDGFSLTNPGRDTSVLIKTPGDNALVTNDIIDTVGGTSFAGNTQGIYLELGPDNVKVVGNRISRIEGIASSNGGVFIGDSTSGNPSINALIQGNVISDIHSVNKGAYGIHVNNGASTAPSATGYTTATIQNNTVSNLVGGGWVHAIGLEGDTPSYLVRENSISNLIGPPNTLVAVWFEDDPNFAAGHVNQNNFDVTIAAFGMLVDPALSAAYPTRVVDGTCNWWGDPSGPGPIGPGLGARVGPNIDYAPWLTARAPGGACSGGSTPGKATGGGRIQSSVDPLALDTVLDLATVLLVSSSSPSSVGGQATFGFAVSCCPARGNLEYNDHGANIQVKATSVTSLIISQPSAACPTGRHAEFRGGASQNGNPVTYQVDVDDCGEPGSSAASTPDRFKIQTSSGYMAEGPLIGGNIQIH